MSNFMKLQIKKIEIDKWCEGCKIQTDPGQDYIINWIENNGQWFRSAYNLSACKSCRNWAKCGYNVAPNCSFFEKG